MKEHPYMSELALFPAYAAIAPNASYRVTTKFAQSELDFVKQEAGHHHDDTLPLLVYSADWRRQSRSVRVLCRPALT